MDQFLRGVSRQFQQLQQLLPSASEPESGAQPVAQQTLEIIKKPRVERVRMLERFSSAEPSPGTLFLTATHLIFVDPKNKKETWICLMHIGSVEKLPLTSAGSPLLLRCKNFRSSTFVVPRETDAHQLYTALSQLSLPARVEELYCFHYAPRSKQLQQTSGWDLYDMQQEYRRMGVPNWAWVVSDMNVEYCLCDTYPGQVAVPAAASHHLLATCAGFRSRRRLPILSYRHNNQATICRCSQPLSGFSGRCPEDEQMLELLRATNPSNKCMCVVDTRPKINAMANRASGKGYENENFYQNIKFHFLAIENIHVMRSSLARLIEVCEARTLSMSQFLGGVEASGWLRHVAALLEAGVFVSESVQAGVSVLVHCSDGWDRTAQTCSLAELLLEPFYRTIRGFQILIEKAWLTTGHKFSDRCGFIQGDSKEVSPIFTQFLDATWQLTQMLPQAFEFNESFLLQLHDHVFSCQFGTFIGNNEKQRRQLKLESRTYSLWGYMATRHYEFVNPLYDPTADASHLSPSLEPYCIKFWSGMYSRFEYGVHARDNVSELAATAAEHNAALTSHIDLLRQRVCMLESLLSGSVGEGGSDKVGQVEAPQPSDHVPLPALNKRQLDLELDSLAITWTSSRALTACTCSTAFDQLSRKRHCWRCGEVFCERCLERRARLPGVPVTSSDRVAPVCQPCYRLLTGSLSVDSQAA